MSIESQITELERRFVAEGLQIVGRFQESRSAKNPGRPIFDDMLDRVEAGEANGIIAWAPDRLSRNSVDGGRIVYMLDRAILIDLRFATYTFENNAQGKFMLQIGFAQSKHYSDNLSDVVKRGNRTKIEKGWRPNKAPIGYLNDPIDRTIVPDPERFPLVRQIFDLALTELYRPARLANIAADSGLRTVQRRRRGGRPLSVGMMYALLRNPFYAGFNLWNGQLYAGRHVPMITSEEYDRIGKLFARRSVPKPIRHTFPFTGMIFCGTCGRAITAEYKVNRHGHRYTYYHCTRGRLGRRCNERVVEAKALEIQIFDFLKASLLGAEELIQIREMASDNDGLAVSAAARMQALRTAITKNQTEQSELISLRLKNLLDDAQFEETRSRLNVEAERLAASLRHNETTVQVIEPLNDVISFNNQAADFFLNGSDFEKKLILKTVSSNLLLSGKKLSIQAAKPFVQLTELAEISKLWAVLKADPSRTDALNEVRAKARELLVEIARNSDVPYIAKAYVQLTAPVPLLRAADIQPPAQGLGDAPRSASA